MQDIPFDLLIFHHVPAHICTPLLFSAVESIRRESQRNFSHYIIKWGNFPPGIADGGLLRIVPAFLPKNRTAYREDSGQHGTKAQREGWPAADAVCSKGEPGGGFSSTPLPPGKALPRRPPYRNLPGRCRRDRPRRIRRRFASLPIQRRSIRCNPLPSAPAPFP